MTASFEESLRSTGSTELLCLLKNRQLCSGLKEDSSEIAQDLIAPHQIPAE